MTGLLCLLCLQGLREVPGHLYHPVVKANVKGQLSETSDGNGQILKMAWCTYLRYTEGY